MSATAARGVHDKRVSGHQQDSQQRLLPPPDKARVDQAELTEGDIIGIGRATFRFSGEELRPYAGEGPGNGDDPGVPDVTVALSPDEALVLFELLHRWEDSGEAGTVLMPGEQTALRALSGLLESILAETLEGGYRELVDSARQRLAERGGA